MGYWKETYGQRSNEFVDGIIEGVRTYAVWKDGKQLVGCMGKHLEDVIEEIKKDFNYNNEVSN